MRYNMSRSTALAIAASAMIVAAPLSAADRQLLAMHDMMPMPSQGQTGGSMGGMQMGDQMRMQQPGQPGQAGPTGGAPAPGTMGSPDQMGGMQMNGNMQMQPPGQMGGGTQGQSPMGQGGSTGQTGASGQMGGMGDNMMRMMNEHMRMMNDRMRMGGGAPGMAMGPGTVDMTERLEGRLAFIRAELRITDAQNSVWNGFADALRSGRDHLLEARHQLQQPYTSSVDRLAQYERHLAERLDALRSARTSFTQLYAVLDDAQKRTADELIAPLIATF